MLIADLALFDLASFGFGQTLDLMEFILVIKQEGQAWPTEEESFQRLNRCFLVGLILENVPVRCQFQPLNMNSAQGSSPSVPRAKSNADTGTRGGFGNAFIRPKGPFWPVLVSWLEPRVFAAKGEKAKRIISDFFRSAVVSTAAVGVPPTEPAVQNRPAFLVSSQARRQ
jgi:hypothetical protein